MLVSICLPTYNYAHYLPQVISTCLAQRYEPLEIIITDDASTDNSREVIESFSDPRITFAVNEQRLGLVGNWNRALSMASGEIIKFIFADDYLEADSIEKYAAPFTDPRIDLVFSACRQIDAGGNYLHTHQPYEETRRLPGRAEAKRCLQRGNYIGSPSDVAVRASALRRVGAFNERLQFHADQEMWIRILLGGDGYFIAEPLASVRIHAGAETSRLEREGLVQTETEKFVRACLSHPQIRSLLTDAEAAEWEAANIPRPAPRLARLRRLARRILAPTGL